MSQRRKGRRGQAVAASLSLSLSRSINSLPSFFFFFPHSPGHATLFQTQLTDTLPSFFLFGSGAPRWGENGSRGWKEWVSQTLTSHSLSLSQQQQQQQQQQAFGYGHGTPPPPPPPPPPPFPPQPPPPQQQQQQRFGPYDGLGGLRPDHEGGILYSAQLAFTTTTFPRP